MRDQEQLRVGDTVRAWPDEPGTEGEVVNIFHDDMGAKVECRTRSGAIFIIWESDLPKVYHSPSRFVVDRSA